jgi:hypothetical protein
MQKDDSISEDETADLRLKSGRYLIGRLMSDRRIPKEAFWTQMSQQWKILDCVAFEEIHDNLWLIEFSNENDKNKDKEGLLWLFDRTVFVLKEVEDSIPPTQMDFTQSRFWVQVHNMPVICMNREVGHRIRATMGMVEEVDVTRDGVGWGHCLQLWVNIDLTKPLDRGRALHLNGKSIWVTFKYEKMPQLCYACGRIYHASTSCKGSKGFRLNEEVPAKQ